LRDDFQSLIPVFADRVNDLDVKHCTIDFCINDEYVFIKNGLMLSILKWDGEKFMLIVQNSIENLYAIKSQSYKSGNVFLAIMICNPKARETDNG